MASNVANINTTSTPQGGPYRRRVPVFAEALAAAGEPGNGVRVAAIYVDPTPPRLVYDPQHPEADARGYVALPNINIVNEMVDLITATRSYEANAAVLNGTKSIALRALEIGRA